MHEVSLFAGGPSGPPVVDVFNMWPVIADARRQLDELKAALA
jgi:hypothetical protein